MPIVEALWKWLNTCEDKPAEISIASLAMQGSNAAITLHPMGETTTRQYISGSRLVDYKFAVFLRVRAMNDQDRAEAFGAAEQLSRWVSLSGGVPDLGEGRKAYRVRETVAPMLVNRDAAADDFQTIYTLTYKEDKPNAAI
ncbi:MAG: hypothetical protein LBB86_01585 [Oscillospiraceae bacterium]|nr:hypothetical protein [Oscillospiraceae bacterium]